MKYHDNVVGYLGSQAEVAGGDLPTIGEFGGIIFNGIILCIVEVLTFPVVYLARKTDKKYREQNEILDALILKIAPDQLEQFNEN